MPYQKKIGSSSRRHVAGRVSAGVAIVLFLTLAVAGVVLAFRGILGQRANNDLTRYLPADTQAVATIDLMPTTIEQVEGLKSLTDAITTVDWSDYVDNQETPVESRHREDAEKLLKTLDGMAVAGMWEAGPNEPAGALIASTRDPKAAEAALAKIARRSRVEDGMTVYTLRTRSGIATAYAAIIEKTLVLASDRAALLRVREIGKNQSPSLSGVAEFREARKMLPPGVMLAVYASPKLCEEAARKNPGTSIKWTKSVKNAVGWVAMGLTLKKDGLLLDSRLPCDSDALTELKRLAKIPALDTDVLHRLPDGAMSTLALSQPSAVGEFLHEVAEEDAEAEEAYERSLDLFEDGTGISLEKDVLPALNGNVLVAVYPNQKNNGADGLLLVDNANGGDPALLSDAARTLYGHDKHNPALVETEKYGATIWRLPENEGGVNRDYNQPHTQDHNAMTWQDSGNRFSVTEWGTGKQEPILAETKDAVLLSSSSQVMDRALRGGQGGGVLTATSDEDDYVLPGAQSLLTISPEKAIDSMMSSGQAQDESSVKFRRIVTPDSQAPLTLSLRYDGKVFQSRLFFPINYKAAAEVIVEANKKNRRDEGVPQDK